MKLSEAIRLGALLKPQGRGELWPRYLRADGQLVIASCALGAACDAAGIKRLSASDDLSRAFPILELTDYSFTCPECFGVGHGVGALITHLNDEHCWAREKIADYVQRIEAGHPQHAEMRPQAEAPEPVEPQLVMPVAG